MGAEVRSRRGLWPHQLDAEGTVWRAGGGISNAEGCVCTPERPGVLCLLMEDAQGWSNTSSCVLPSQFQGREIAIMTTRIFLVPK